MTRRIISMIRRVQKICDHRSHTKSDVSLSLAKDLGIPYDVVNRVLEQTAADLDELAAVDDTSDAGPIINKAMDEIAKYGCRSRPYEEAIMERCLEQLPERDLNILRLFKQGKKHREIAELMGTDVESIRGSLVQTYTDLRMKMRDFDGDEPVKKAAKETQSA